MEVTTRSRISPPSATRTHSAARALATQTEPSAHRQMPSGATPASGRPLAPVGQRAVRGAVERGQAAAQALGDDQRGAVLGDDGAVGEGDVGGRLAAGAVGVDPDERRRRDGARRRPSRRRGRRGRTRSCPRRPGRSTPPPCRWRARSPRAGGRRAARASRPASRRMMTRSRRELMRSRPSGSQPSPAGSPSKSTSTRRSPSGDTENTAWSKKSEYHSRPSCQRGHSPK